MSGFFDGSRNAGTAGEGQKIRPGKYARLRVHEIKGINGHFGKRAAFSFEVIEPGQPTEYDKAGQPVPPSLPGAIEGVTIQIDGQYGKSGLAECNTIMGAIMGLSPEETKARLDEVEGELNRAVGPGNPYKGIEVSLIAFSHVTKAAGRTMAKVKEVQRLSPGFGVLASTGTITPASLPVAPPVKAPAAVAAPTFPPAGWYPHPDAPGFFYNAASEVKSEADLRAGA